MMAEKFQLGERVLIKFPQEESGKLSTPWHGPYRIMKLTDTDITAIKIYFQKLELSKFIRVECHHVHWVCYRYGGISAKVPAIYQSG